MIRRPPRSTRVRSSAASDVYKRQPVAVLDPGRADRLGLPPGGTQTAAGTADCARTRVKERAVDILDELAWRGLVAQTTDEQALREALSAGPVTVYSVSYTHL